MKQKVLCMILAMLLLSMGCNVQKPIENHSAVSETEPSIVTATPEPTASSAPSPEPSAKTGTRLIINPEIGKHNDQISFGVAVQNTPIPDDYAIRHVSDKPPVKTEGRVSEQTVQRFWELYKMLPDSLCTAFEADEFKVLITKKNLTEYYDGSRNTKGHVLNGIFSNVRKTIFFYGTEDALEHSLFHEFGHYLDWKNGFPSRTDEFEAIYAEEKDLIGNPTITDATELFADVFQSYLLGKDITTPKAMAFVQRYIVE